MSLSESIRFVFGGFALLYLTHLSAQEPQVVIQQDSSIVKALQLKIEVNKEQFANEVYSIQLFYGKHDAAEEIMTSVAENFPELSPVISFETPNYKVQVGPFEAYLNALEELKRLKAIYKEAFILQPKREL